MVEVIALPRAILGIKWEVNTGSMRVLIEYQFTQEHIMQRVEPLVGGTLCIKERVIVTLEAAELDYHIVVDCYFRIFRRGHVGVIGNGLYEKVWVFLGDKLCHLVVEENKAP